MICFWSKKIFPTCQSIYKIKVTLGNICVPCYKIKAWLRSPAVQFEEQNSNDARCLHCPRVFTKLITPPSSSFPFLHPQPPSSLKKERRQKIILRVIKLFRVHCLDTGDKSRQDGQYWKCGGTDGRLQHADQWKAARRTALWCQWLIQWPLESKQL